MQTKKPPEGGFFFGGPSRARLSAERAVARENLPPAAFLTRALRALEESKSPHKSGGLFLWWTI